MVNPVYQEELQRRNKICEEQLKRFFDSIEIETPFEPWQTDRWKSRREELIGDECLWCGATDDLQVHHEEHGPTWPSMWTTARDRLFFETAYQPAKYAPHEGVCPNCRNSSYSGRVTKSPTYKCQSCNSKFEEPLLYPCQDAVEDDLWSDLTDWTEQHGDEITDRFEEQFWKEWEAYFEGEDTVTLCRSCHNEIDGESRNSMM